MGSFSFFFLFFGNIGKSIEEYKSIVHYTFSDKNMLREASKRHSSGRFLLVTFGLMLPSFSNLIYVYTYISMDTQLNKVQWDIGKWKTRHLARARGGYEKNENFDEG